MKNGFTLIELILVIALVAIISSFSAPVYTSFISKNNLENKTFEIKGVLTKAESNTISGKQDLNWGVYFLPNKFILFAGDSYISRNPAFDETHSFPSSVSVSGISEIVFQSPRGQPSTTGTITITSQGDSNTVSINSEGSVDIN